MKIATIASCKDTSINIGRILCAPINTFAGAKLWPKLGVKLWAKLRVKLGVKLWVNLGVKLWVKL